MNEIEKISDEILKTAGIIRTVNRTLGSSVLGAGLGAVKGVGANEQNPGATADEKLNNVLGGAAGGALIGGAIGGPGIGCVKSIGKKITNKTNKLGTQALGFFKKSDMEVPHEDDDKITTEESEVRDSPNNTEKRRMINSITKEDEHKQFYKNQIEKSALYMNNIECEVCGFDGTPNSNDGRCPECGALGGVMPKPEIGENRNDELATRELRENNLQRDVEQSIRESVGYY